MDNVDKVKLEQEGFDLANSFPSISRTPILWTDKGYTAKGYLELIEEAYDTLIK